MSEPRTGGERALWRALEERGAGRDDGARAEFAPGSEPPGSFRVIEPLARDGRVTRREFLTRALGAGASVALAGWASGCGRHDERIVPCPVRRPELTPGVPTFYATALPSEGLSIGVLVESHDGRPTKVEGNPDHPASLGGTSAHEQAAILGLYDPDRGRTVLRRGEPASLETLARAFAPDGGGRGLRVLLEPDASPLTAELVSGIRAALPAVEVHYHTPLGDTAERQATRALLGRPLAVQRDLSKASTILALDADFLGAGPAMPRDARRFAARRAPDATAVMTRLYVVEPSLTPTGIAADHRIVRRPSEVARLAGAVLAELVIGLESPIPGATAALRSRLERLRASDGDARMVKAIARDLASHRGSGLTIAGAGQPASVHAMAALIDELLGNAGSARFYTDPPIADAGEPPRDLHTLCEAIDRGHVRSLLIIGGNPVYGAPAELDLVARLARVETTAYVGAYEDETARACAWYAPLAHPLESWGDGRAVDGTASLVQPLIRPLFGGRTVAETLAALVPGGPRDGHDLLRESWRRRSGLDDAAFEQRWRRSLSRGVVEGTAFAPLAVRVSWESDQVLAQLDAAAPPPTAPIEIVFARDAAAIDGRSTNNPWLLELPDPATKLTWEKAALLSPGTAGRLGVATGDVVRVERSGRSLVAPVFVLPGHADEAVTLPLGYGRGGAESRARGLGFAAGRLRTSDSPRFAGGAAIERTGERRTLATTQMHWSLEGRDPVRDATLARFRAAPDFAKDPPPRTLKLYEPWPASGPEGSPQWGMAIDLGKCTGCSACVTACQAENNVPAVGAEEVAKGRAMHWIRIDRYFRGPEDAPEVLVQPMLCQHCEAAPCEYVCPVNATTHSPDGLNEQTYNRCVGTRFCSNNCAWKVRRFNWFDFHLRTSEVERMAMNPDVTVRDRGVMEKCTLCVQRIREAEIDARTSGRARVDGDVRTACQQACPAEAIVFGSIADPGSRVSAAWRDPRSYTVLGELGTRPRIRYLARVRNPNPEIVP